jgi:tRNA pseudouridine38-40 synthase
VEYDGTAYFGSQLQANQPTVQEELEKALKNLTGENIRISLASRTDTGVHAQGQVVSFKTGSSLPEEAFIHGMNYHLPQDIAVKAAYKVMMPFDPRRMAVSREYSYNIVCSDTRSPTTSRFTCRIHGELNIEAMNKACAMLTGAHDFASFASEIGDEPEKSTIRHIFSAAVSKKDNMVVFSIFGNAFLRHQVRNTAGALTQVGLGKISLEDFKNILDAKQPGLAGPTLPACGLTLVKVNYACSIEEMKQ